MRQFITGFIAASIVVTLCAQNPPTTVNYQGRLTDNSPGQAPVSATVPMKFEIFDALTAGTSLWNETPAGGVVVSGGIFNVALGSTTPLGPAVFTGANSTRYLEITVNPGASQEILAPRQLITATGYANLAQSANDSAALGGAAAATWQKRVTGTCSAGSTVSAVNADGTVTCATDALGAGTAAGNTTYWSGTAWVANSANLFNNGGNVGIGTNIPGGKLDVRVPGGTGTWDRLVVTTTSQWDGSANYLTLGAGGAAGIMFSNPHVTWYAPDLRASLRYGRVGGGPVGTWWDAGLRADGSFTFALQNGASSLTLPAGGGVLVPSLSGSGNRLVYADPTGTLTTGGAGSRYFITAYYSGGLTSISPLGVLPLTTIGASDGWTLSSNVVTCPVSGTYQATWSVYSGTTSAEIALQVNSVTVPATRTRVEASQYNTLSTILALNPSDVVRLVNSGLVSIVVGTGTSGQIGNSLTLTRVP